MKFNVYLLFLIITGNISLCFGSSFQEGVFESCETEYYTVHEVRFIPIDKYSSHVTYHSELREKVHKRIEDSFKRGSFESCGLMGCSIDFVAKK